MYKVAVCDDEINTMEDIVNILSEMYDNILEIKQYGSGEDIMYDIEENERFDIILLDIFMKGMDGIEVAEKIRKKSMYDDVKIMFITAFTADISKIVDLQPFAYIYKDNLETNLRHYMHKAVENLEKSKIIEFSTNRMIMRVDEREITYIEVKENKLQIHIGNDVYETRTFRIKDIINILSDTLFIRCHQSYVVNYNYIKHMTKNEILMKNGDIVPVSRKFREDVLKFEN